MLTLQYPAEIWGLGAGLLALWAGQSTCMCRHCWREQWWLGVLTKKQEHVVWEMISVQFQEVWCRNWNTSQIFTCLIGAKRQNIWKCDTCTPGRLAKNFNFFKFFLFPLVFEDTGVPEAVRPRPASLRSQIDHLKSFPGIARVEVTKPGLVSWLSLISCSALQRPHGVIACSSLFDTYRPHSWEKSKAGNFWSEGGRERTSLLTAPIWRQ